MAAINFPDSPSNGDTHTVGGVTYTYNSAETKWKTTINSNAFLPLSGGTVSGNIVLGGELQHSGDTDTKITFGTDTINLDTAGSTRATVDSSGRVGIGVTNPSYKLDILHTANSEDIIARFRNSGTVSSDFQIKQGSSNLETKLENSGALILAPGNTERARITSTGDLRFNSGYGSAATAYGVRAWINFDGTAATIGTGRASGNMDAVTDHGTGDYTVNFTTDMPDVNYAVFGASGLDGSTASSGRSFQINKTSPTVGSLRFSIRTTSAADFNDDIVCVCIVR